MIGCITAMNKDIPVGKKMTDKEKIAQIIAEHLCPQGKSHKRLYGSERVCYSRDNFAECEKVSKCVDALIAAGIGDTTNLIVENKVLQRALLTTCVKLIEDEVDNVNAELLARVVYTKALRKAKKRSRGGRKG